MPRGQNAQQVVPVAQVVPVQNKTVLRPRINDVAYDVAFSVPDGMYSITLLSISYKDGSKKDSNGKFIVVEKPYEGMPNLRAWLMLKAVDDKGAVYQLCQEYAKAHACCALSERILLTLRHHDSKPDRIICVENPIVY